MKPRLLSTTFLTLILLILAACGGTTASKTTTPVILQPTSTQAQASPTLPQPTDTPSPTATAEPQPTPTKTTPANAKTVQITLVEYQIISSQTTFSVNVPYHFIVTNKGQIDHQFMIMSVGQLGQPPLAAIALLKPGETQSLDFTFTQPAATGQLEFACHIHGHYSAGMKLPIIVN